MLDDDETIAAVREVVATRGAAGLKVDNLRAADLDHLGWSGSPLHIKSVTTALDLVGVDLADYLVVRAPSGYPVAKGGADHADPERPGKIWQLATHPSLQSLGIGALLIGALEDRIRGRGIEAAWLGVEHDNPRARALYERLGYEPFGEAVDGWEHQDEHGKVSWYSTIVTLMRHRLAG
jgi:ribosomal protein S18 acetylase RimI-like enzyme